MTKYFVEIIKVAMIKINYKITVHYIIRCGVRRQLNKRVAT